MEPMSSVELSEKYSDHEFLESFLRLYALRNTIGNAIFPPDYAAPAELETIVELTDFGKEVENHLPVQDLSLSPGDGRLALFNVFAHRDLIVDPLRTDYGAMREVISSQIAQMRIRYIPAMGRDLYDRFFEMYGHRDGLSPEESLRLLEGTPQGVYQVGHSITGPFGLLESVVFRWLSPTREAPLSHCSDPGCQGLHSVALRTSRTPSGQAYAVINEYLDETYGMKSDWHGFWWEEFMPDSLYYADFNPANFPLLLANALSEIELRALLQEVLTQHAGTLRPRLPTSSEDRDFMHSPPGAIVDGLNREAMYQLLLLASDEQLIQTLEELIDSGRIYIPATEVRISPVRRRAATGWTDQTAELSRFGVRFISRSNRLAVPRLKSLLKLLHGDDDGLADLEWQLLDISGSDIFAKLDKLVNETDPRTIVRDLVVSRRGLFKGMTEYLQFGNFVPPASAADKEALIDRVLWKLGFLVATYPTANDVFWRRLRTLQAAIVGNTGSETGREEIRSVAVNFFVSLEEVLDSTLAFCVWSLFSDHYSESRPERFKYNLTEARKVAASKLNGYPLGNGETLNISSSGRTNLFGLIEGLRITADLCENQISEEDRSAYERPAIDFPGYAGETGLELFPFENTLALLDLDEAAVHDIASLLRDASRSLVRSNLMSVRNRVPHGGGDFPTEEEFATALTATEQVVRMLEDAGALPLVWQFTGSNVDEYGRSGSHLQNYRGKSLVLYYPSELETCGLPASGAPQVIFKIARIRGSSEVLRFAFQEDSEYSSMWDKYPRRSE
jgi:hypothetical protein